jgi:hypothetical protein
MKKITTLILGMACYLTMLNAQLTNLAHHSSNINDDGISCTNGLATSHARTFVLSDFSISNPFEILEVEFFSRSTAGVFYYYIDIYEKDLTPAFPAGTLNLIGRDSIQKTWTNDSLVSVPIQQGSIYMEPGKEYVVMVSTPNVGSTVYPVGYNRTGSETSPSYIGGSCTSGFSTVSSLGFSNYFLILTLKGRELSPEFSTRWYFQNSSTELQIAVQTDGVANFSWNAYPSGNSGNGTINNASFTLTSLPGINIAAGDTVDLYIEGQNLRRFGVRTGLGSTGVSNQILNLIDVFEWSDAPFINMNNMFQAAANLQQISAPGVPNLQNCTNMGFMFYQCTAFTGGASMANWDVSTITNMTSMFDAVPNFNINIGSWNTENVDNMAWMFFGASSFNQTLGAWDLSSVTQMQNFLNNSGVDCDNYTQTLIGWADNPNTPNNITLGATGRQYGTNAVAARNTLVNTKGWTINGDIAGSTTCPITCSDTFSSIAETACEIYEAPDGASYTTSGTFTAIIPNEAGCDSIITINLVVNYNVETYISTEACGSYTTGAGEIYFSPGNYEEYLIAANGCDSTVYYQIMVVYPISETIVVVGDSIRSEMLNATSFQWYDCATNDPIDGATERVFYPTAPGNYKVVASVSWCNVESECVSFGDTGTSINSLNAGNLQVYPNPVKDMLHVTADNAVSIEIYDIRGAKVLSVSENTVHAVSVSGLSSGMYLLKAGNQTYKFVKN